MKYSTLHGPETKTTSAMSARNKIWSASKFNFYLTVAGCFVATNSAWHISLIMKNEAATTPRRHVRGHRRQAGRRTKLRFRKSTSAAKLKAPAAHRDKGAQGCVYGPLVKDENAEFQGEEEGIRGGESGLSAETRMSGVSSEGMAPLGWIEVLRVLVTMAHQTLCRKGRIIARCLA